MRRGKRRRLVALAISPPDTDKASRAALPAKVQEALVELVHSANEGLLAGDWAGRAGRDAGGEGRGGVGSRHMLEQTLAALATRRFQRTRERVSEEIEASARSTSKSSASRGLVARLAWISPQGVMWATDRAEALGNAIEAVLGLVPVQRCIRAARERTCSTTSPNAIVLRSGRGCAGRGP